MLKWLKDWDCRSEHVILFSSHQGNFKIVRLLLGSGFQVQVSLWARQKIHCCPWPSLRNQITSFPPFSTSWRVTNPPKCKGKGYRPHFSVRGWMPGSHWGRACGLRREGIYSWGHLWKILSASAWKGNLRSFHSIICWCSTALFLDKNISMNYLMLTTKY